jgi:hypothetical protein
MLNRTNRTLTANLNRLNLGTRSLALTGAVNGKGAQGIHHAHGTPMRDGMFGSSDPSIIRPSSRIRIIDIPGSSPVEPWPAEGWAVRPPVGLPVTPVVPVVDRARTATAAACLAGTAPSRTPSRFAEKRVKPVRDALKGKRAGQGYARGAYRAYAAAAWAPAAATAAAAGG